MDKFQITIIDKKSTLEEKDIVNKLIEKIIDNPFAAFNKMDFAYKNKWDKTPNSISAVKEVLKKKARIALGTREPHFLLVSLDKNAVQNVLLMDIDQAYLQLFSWEMFREYILEIAGLFDAFHSCSVSSITNVNDFYLAHNIPVVPADSFRMYTHWTHFISSEVYQKDFEKEVLLACPAYKVQEHKNGIIEIQVYEQAFSINDPQTIEQIRKVNSFLSQNLKPL